jgi:minimal PKS acyl carrier protein
VFTLDDLRDIMHTAGGIQPGEGFADVPFTDLGYDSLAVLEISGRIAERIGVRLPEGSLTEDTTPVQTATYVNSLLAVGR